MLGAIITEYGAGRLLHGGESLLGAVPGGTRTLAPENTGPASFQQPTTGAAAKAHHQKEQALAGQPGFIARGANGEQASPNNTSILVHTARHTGRKKFQQSR